jgi:hypothetical protein
MLNFNLKSDLEARFKRLAENYKGNYNNLFSDIISYYITELKKGMKNTELDLSYFENKYSMTSKELYDKFEKGKLGDENSNFFQWSGEYEIWFEHKKDLEELQ